MPARKKKKRRSSRKKSTLSRYLVYVKNCRKATVSALKHLAVYMHKKHLELVLLLILCYNTSVLHNLSSLVKEGMVAIYTQSFINDMMHSVMLKSILKSLEVFIKDA